METFIRNYEQENCREFGYRNFEVNQVVGTLHDFSYGKIQKKLEVGLLQAIWQYKVYAKYSNGNIAMN